jgi:hypothetical protein
MNATTNAEVVAQVGRELLEQFCDLQDMWASAPEVAWRIAGPSPKGRSDVYRGLDQLSDLDVWKSIVVVHNKGPLRAFRVDPRPLRKILAEGQ